MLGQLRMGTRTLFADTAGGEVPVSQAPWSERNLPCRRRHCSNRGADRTAEGESSGQEHGADSVAAQQQRQAKLGVHAVWMTTHSDLPRRQRRVAGRIGQRSRSPAYAPSYNILDSSLPSRPQATSAHTHGIGGVTLQCWIGEAIVITQH